MYHIERKVRYSNGKETIMVGYDIADDNGSLIESFVSEGRMEEYARMNRQERKRKEVNKMSTNVHDIDKIRRIESVGYAYDGEMKYDEKLFILFDPKTYREIKKKCFYFLIGPTSKSWSNNMIYTGTSIDHILNRITAKEFDDYMKNPDNSKFRLIPARIERI